MSKLEGLINYSTMISNKEPVINLINTVCGIVPNARIVGWDVSIKDDGKICLIEGNHNPGADVHQMAAKKGLRSIYKKYLGDF